MVTLNAIVCHSKKYGNYVAHCWELNVVGTGQSESVAIGELVGSLDVLLTAVSQEETKGKKVLLPRPASEYKMLQQIVFRRSPKIATQTIREDLILDVYRGRT
jgi:hypothetical protein